MAGGIQSVDSAFPKVCQVDSRFRGNDCGFERPCLANNTSTRTHADLRIRVEQVRLAEGCERGTSEKLTVRRVLTVATPLNPRRRRPKSGPARLLP
jgi:hypothetical protein